MKWGIQNVFLQINEEIRLAKNKVEINKLFIEVFYKLAEEILCL